MSKRNLFVGCYPTVLLILLLNDTQTDLCQCWSGCTNVRESSLYIFFRYIAKLCLEVQSTSYIAGKCLNCSLKCSQIQVLCHFIYFCPSKQTIFHQTSQFFFYSKQEPCLKCWDHSSSAKQGIFFVVHIVILIR